MNFRNHLFERFVLGNDDPGKCVVAGMLKCATRVEIATRDEIVPAVWIVNWEGLAAQDAQRWYVIGTQRAKGDLIHFSFLIGQF